MKQSAILITSFLVLAASSVFAQDQITEDELMKYAVAMDSINDMKSTLLKEIDEMVASNEKMTNARYNELYAIMGDETKLQAAKATEEEIAFMKKVADTKSEGTVEITDTFKKLAKEYVGATSYNKVKKALATDKVLEAKYKTMLAELDKAEIN